MNAGHDKLELFAENTQRVKRDFFWQFDSVKRLAALLYAQEGRPIDCEAIRQCYDLIKQNTGVFSQFQGTMALCVATLLSLSPNPQERLDETLKVYDLLKGAGFHATDFLVVAAYQIAAQSSVSKHEVVVTRTRDFYDAIKARHLFLTGEDDYIFAAMLGLTDLDVATGAEHIEHIYSRLKGEFWDNNSIQTLAQVLVLGNSDAGVIERVLALRDALRARRIKLDKTYTLPVLGVLALLPVEIHTVVSDIDAAQTILRAEKGFGMLSIDTAELLLYVTSIVAGDYAKSAKDEVLRATFSTSITNLIIAQQTAMIAMMLLFASSAATASAASSGS
ncbi:MAG: DUF4003 domain-containing protein [Coriobacteriales bacterium]|jgi:hypothetical protein|nr:DUF4003 domain-containing protein [Coriobacteriales bacterium]